jgi:hypothetical protein
VNGGINNKVKSILSETKAKFLVLSPFLTKIGSSKREISIIAHKLVRNSPCPVISINGPVKYNGFRSILLPLGFSQITLQKVKKVIEFAGYFNSEIHVASFCNTGANEEKLFRVRVQLKQVKQWIEKSKIKCKTQMVKTHRADVSLAAKILSYAREQDDIDLIAIMVKKKYNLLEYILGSTNQRLLKISEIPVMTFIPEKSCPRRIRLYE